MKRILFIAIILCSINATAQLGLGYGNTDSVPPTNAKGAVVRQAPADLWRCSFASVGSGLLTTDVTLLQTGSGMAVSQSAGNLVITTGTTANSETLIKSVKSFSGAFVARFKTILSQRIAQNNFSYELADIIGQGLSYSITNSTTVVVTFGSNPFTSANVGQFVNLSVITGAAGIPGRFAIASVSGSTTTFTVAGWPASGSGTLMIWGWNYHRVLYNGTTATSALVDAQRRGWASGDATITINTTATGTVAQIENDGSMVGYSDALVATNAAYQFTGRGSRMENIPDPNDNLYLFIRVLNGTSAPATTTTLTTGFVSVEEVSNNKVFISGATQNGENFALPVSVKGTHPVTITSGTVTTVTTVGTVSTLTAGPTAASAASANNPIQIGGATVPTTPATQDQTYVAGDVQKLPLTTGAQLINKPYSTSEIDWQYAAATGGIVSSTTAVTFKAASGTAGIRNYITSIDISADGAGTATELAIRDGAAGTVIWRIRVPAAGFATPQTFNFTTPLKGTANTLLEVVTLTSSATPVFFNAHGYTGF